MSIWAHRKMQSLKLVLNICRVLSNLNTGDLKAVVIGGNQAASARDRNILDVLTSTSDAVRQQHQQLSSAHASQHRSLDQIQKEQTTMKTRQQQHMNASRRARKEITCVSQTLRQQTRISMTQHRKTQVLVQSALGELHKMQLMSPLHQTSSDRPIYFQGERRDLIMTHLLFLRDGLDLAFEQLSFQHDTHSTLKDFVTLQSNFESLLSSAAQEQAMQYSRSTARPFDQWVYEERALDLTKFCPTNQQTTDDATGKTILVGSRVACGNQNPRRKRRSRTSRLTTSLGDLFVYTKDSSIGGLVEVGVSMVQKGPLFPVRVDAQFTHRTVDGPRIPLYTHLRTFMVIEDGYRLLLMAPLLREYCEPSPVSNNTFSGVMIESFQTGDIPLCSVRTNGNLYLLEVSMMVLGFILVHDRLT